jgi:hypothetical protein
LRGGGVLRVMPVQGEAVEITLPDAVRARAAEIVLLSRRLGDRGAGFKEPDEVLAPALVYGLAHMQQRYRQAALRADEGVD